MNQENHKLAEIKGHILSELNALNYHQKAVLLAFYIDGLQWEQISERLNYSPRQCRNIRDDGWTLWESGSAGTRRFRGIVSRKNKIATHCLFFLLKWVL